MDFYEVLYYYGNRTLEFRLKENVGWMLCRDFLLCLKSMGVEISLDRILSSTSIKIRLNLWDETPKELIHKLDRLLLEKKLPIQRGKLVYASGEGSVFRPRVGEEAYHGYECFEQVSVLL